MGFNSAFKGLRLSNSFLRLLPCLTVISIPPCIFPSITRCRRQFLRKIWPIQLAFRLRISRRIFLCSMTLSKYFFISHMISPTDLFHPPPAPHFETFQVFLFYCPKLILPCLYWQKKKLTGFSSHHEGGWFHGTNHDSCKPDILIDNKTGNVL